MSNVIIGIIGVVLFIGLALAGAVILGTDFMNAANDSKAVALVAAANQVAGAHNAYLTKEGDDPATVTASALTPRYLKSVPLNPTNTAATFDAVDSTGALALPGYAIVSGVGLSTVAGMPVCRSIAQNAGMPVPASGVTNYASLAALPTPVGCFQASATIGALVKNSIYVYVKL